MTPLFTGAFEAITFLTEGLDSTFIGLAAGFLTLLTGTDALLLATFLLGTTFFTIFFMTFNGAVFLDETVLDGVFLTGRVLGIFARG